MHHALPTDLHGDRYSYQSAKGFTLIELMISIAIIGLLAAIAIPSLSNYVVRAQIGHALQTLAPLRNAVEDLLLAGVTGAAIDNEAVGMPANASTLGTIRVGPFNDSGVGEVVLTFDGSAATILREAGARIGFERAETGNWTCVAHGIPAARLPSQCQ